MAQAPGTTDPLIWLTEKDVVGLVDLNDAIEALERVLRADGEGKAQNVPKSLGTWADGSSLHALASMVEDPPYAGTKTWVNTRRGAQAVYILFNADDGTLLAVMEAVALGMMRTSGISGLATRWLAASDADDMALIGTGSQAFTQVPAVGAVRRLRRLRVFSPTPEKRRAFVDQARSELPFEVVEAESVEACVADAPIVTTVTRAAEPFLTADMLATGAHLNAVGAILPQKAEFTQDVFARTSMVVGDYIPNLKRASREFIDRFEDGPADWSDVITLSEVIAGGQGRPDGADLTLFKAMGMGLSDLSVAIMVYERARAQGVGHRIDQPGRARPRWRVLGGAA